MLTLYVESRFLYMLRAALLTTGHVVYCFILSLSYQFKGTHAYAPSPALVDSDLNMHIQAASKERVSQYSCAIYSYPAKKS